MIVDTDAKNEADDQFAIVHALLSPSLDIRGLVPAHFGNRRTRQSLEESRAEIDLLLRLLKLDDLEPLADKWRAFGWEAVEVDGHDHLALLEALTTPCEASRPRCLIARTVKGRGVSFMEDRAE
ncbi:hypothetical protein ABGB18_07420 [Nonomuraea sp. B12E4]|uniref:hypothetical protein n=1 Tax=Nonomuraea sp. B12E4 TaxID=3153564 RepID=UPI00325C4B28